MKKLLLLSTAILLASCSSDDAVIQEVEKKCNCEEFARRQTKYYNRVTGIATTSGWKFTGGKNFYSNDCKDDGKFRTETQTFNGTNSQGLDVYTDYGWIVICK